MCKQDLQNIQNKITDHSSNCTTHKFVYPFAVNGKIKFWEMQAWEFHLWQAIGNAV